MAETFDTSHRQEAPVEGSNATPFIADPLVTGTPDMGFQIGLWDAAGIAAMTTDRIPR